MRRETGEVVREGVVVARAVDPNAVVGGVPAKLIKRLCCKAGTM